VGGPKGQIAFVEKVVRREIREKIRVLDLKERIPLFWVNIECAPNWLFPYVDL